MFNFLFRNIIISSAQRSIDRLKPPVAVHIPKDLPLPSVGIIKKRSAVAARINALEKEIQPLSDRQLREKTDEFKRAIAQHLEPYKKELADVRAQYLNAASHEHQQQMSDEVGRVRARLTEAKNKILDSILPEAFAVAREAGRRTIGLRHFDVQMIGGMALHEGKIAEMATGEGKTLVATLAAYLNALTGEGVHVITVNDYLAKRDSEWMGPIYTFLGLTVGVIQHDMDPRQRQVAYHCDITYGTNNEFGFDYLRDNMVGRKEDVVQGPHHFAIVDEVDSILIDEARTPLIISGPAEESTDKYYTAYDISRKLKGRRITEKEEIDAKYKGENLSEGFDYIADEKARSISLTEQGEQKAAQLFGIDNLHDMETVEYRHHILQSLKAKEFFQHDVDYVIRDGKVIIVDEFTGRMMPGRRWSDGLHQAVEAKEGIKIERENQTLATITFQNYFRMYEKLSGMTGTAYTEAGEFKQIYNLDCVVMPTNRILQRTNYPDCIYKTVNEKFNAVVGEICALHEEGRPVLVGTISIEKSELLSDMLKRRGIPHQVLNAKYHEMEAHIVAQAGRHKAVTIATNMAGRGTDILLGGNAEHLAHNLIEQQKQDAPQEEKQAADQEKYRQFLKEFQQQVSKEHEQVVAIGGLHVLGTGRHESRRIDNQLRGRSGRQGDPGSSRFYVSLQDDLMRLFGSDRIMNIMDTLGMEEGQVIEHPLVSRAIEVAQKRVEGHNFEIRKQLIEYDNVMNKQREVIYTLRRSILDGENIQERIAGAIEDAGHDLVGQHLSSDGGETVWDIEGMREYVKNKYGLSLTESKEQLNEMSKNEVTTLVCDGLQSLYREKEAAITPEHMRQLERIVLLQTIDAKWKDHLRAMDELKEGVGLRAYGQRDPLVEYQHEAFSMFQEMYALINREVAEILFKVQPLKDQQRRPKTVFSSLPQQAVHNDFTSLSDKAVRPVPGAAAPVSGEHRGPPPAAPQKRDADKVGRNDPCPCGSGKKYKKCCGR